MVRPSGIKRGPRTTGVKAECGKNNQRHGPLRLVTPTAAEDSLRLIRPNTICNPNPNPNTNPNPNRCTNPNPSSIARSAADHPLASCMPPTGNADLDNFYKSTVALPTGNADLVVAARAYTDGAVVACRDYYRRCLAAGNSAYYIA